MKQKLDLKREKERLSTGSQRYWEDTMKDIEVISKQLNMTKTEKEAFIQRTAAQIVYRDLEATNAYLKKSGDDLSLRKIQKNTLEMQRMSHVYSDHAQDVQRIQAQANAMLISRRQSTATQQTTLTRKGAK